MTVWPGRSPPARHWEKSLERGDYCNLSLWWMSAHTGTHMDAPFHFVPGGKTIDQIPPDMFMGECHVIDIRSTQGVLMDESLARRFLGVKRLLLRSHHSDFGHEGDYQPHGPLLTTGAAELLLDRGLQLLGTDRLSIDDSQTNTYDLHRQVLGAECVILEGLDLSAVEPGTYLLVVPPLQLEGAEASPVRALLALK